MKELPRPRFVKIMNILKSYKYRLLPTDDQRQKVNHFFGCCRFVYNLALETKITAWRSAKVNLTAYELMKQLTELKQTECLWLQDCYSLCMESAIKNMDNAYKSFFSGKGFPKFKKKSNRQSIQFRQGCEVKDDEIWLPKIGWVKFINHRELPFCEIRTVSVSKSPTNLYFVSILVKTADEIPEKAPITTTSSVGIDVGLKTFATLSDGKSFENQKYLFTQLKRLKKEQRTLSRRYKKGISISSQSKGYHEQRLVVAKIHEKIYNQRADFLHKISSEIIDKYDTICIETLNIKGMQQNGSLSKSISDVGWYKFIEFLTYKCEWNGKNLIKVGMFDPTSKTCSVCGHVFSGLKLSNREWDCEKCGSHHDRDENAATNIKNFAITKSKTL